MAAGDRAEVMAENDVDTCPVWCEQTDEELERAAHVGSWSQLETAAGDVFRARALAAWHDVDQEDIVELATPGGVVPLNLIGNGERWALEDLISDCEIQISHWRTYILAENRKPAYEGAWDRSDPDAPWYEDDDEDDEDDNPYPDDYEDEEQDDDDG